MTRSPVVVDFLYFLSVLFVSSVIGISLESLNDQRKVYIVYMGSLPEGEYLARDHHISMMQALGHNKIMADEKLIRSYTRSFNGFAANLNKKELSILRVMRGIVSVFPSQQFQAQTTRSWDYIGMSLKDVSQNPNVESDIIIGHLDAGVRPESHSFSDHGLGPIPTKWKGACLGGKNFTCNKKLIGARFYELLDTSANDLTIGHGTHTASTAAGRAIKNSNFFGIANGTVRGGVPSTRLAVYKVCNSFCDGHNILAGFDDAIADNVDIITISISYNSIQNISDNVISIGSFHAMEKDILTVNAAGNLGSSGFGSTASIEPWIFTIGASADRTINNKFILGNGRTLMSNAVNGFDMSTDKKLVYGRSVSSRCNESFSTQCTLDCIDPHLVNGNILVCDIVITTSSDIFVTAQSVGASGVVVREGEDLIIYGPKIVPMPTAILKNSDFQYVKSYLKSKIVNSARIIKSEIVLNHAPVVPSFSSKGPNTIFPQIFKPDISAPGVNILAANLREKSPSEYASNSKTFHSSYTFMTGTSMACPHVAGAVAYVKSKHLDWSASAIKSSLMTTARNMNFHYNIDDELGHGAGYIDPMKAIHPGLVYETSKEDYFKMFCGLGPEGVKLRKIFRRKKKCMKGIETSPKDLNYPAMTSSVHKNSNFTISFFRTVTNVGHANSTYNAQVSTGDNMVYINVVPNVLSFVNLKEKKSFLVIVTGNWLNQDHVSCSLIWFDGTHKIELNLAMKYEEDLDLLNISHIS
ncbi:subtilisin-like protease SBT4.3 [Impatiens glandulifera]|uniref:subtilisin-like protease SBT4.3 n=1 Tax=Impatiens glandulifera TaxID=253017 RepID=UPI001FB11FB0|nr:subtilisin-like protease SBT4.3 [Impatiens glandulifera]